MSFDLRSWLKRVPKPAKLRIRTVDGEERIIELGDGVRVRWHVVEETVRTSGAASVECLDLKGGILRAQRLITTEEDPDAEDDPVKSAGKQLARERTELANVLDRFGDRIKEAYLAGAQASSMSQDKLVDLVETLTSHLSVAIVNMHNVSTNLANIVQTNAETVASLQQAIATSGGEEGREKLLGQVLGIALSGGKPPTPPPVTTPPNGKGKPHA